MVLWNYVGMLLIFGGFCVVVLYFIGSAVIKYLRKKQTERCFEETINSKLEYVDLGLPSGLLWATCNVGASKPEDYGLYFAWGETVGYTAEQIGALERSFYESSYNAGKAASISADLTLEQDAAHVCMGGDWRMPTKKEWDELIDNVRTEFISIGNIKGMLLISDINGNGLFIPASGVCVNSTVDFTGIIGWCWSSNIYSEKYAYDVIIRNGGEEFAVEHNYRYCGFPVRGVRKIM